MTKYSRTLLYLAALSGIMSVPAAHANFQVKAKLPIPPPESMNRRYPVVQGFGHGVPLHLALQLITPGYVRVIIAPGVNTNLPLTWKGGRPWPATLASALAQIGLNLTATTMTATITKKKSR